LFDAVSVREISGVKLCEKYLGIKSEQVLDPTFLLDKSDYLKLIGRQSKECVGGIFTYWLDANEAKSDAANILSKTLNASIYQCQAKLSINNVNGNIDDYNMPRVEDWLASFDKASFILTDSFHGVVFSIIFEKPFFVMANEKRGVARLKSILNDLDLNDRLVCDGQEVTYEMIHKPINYLEVKFKLDKLKDKSIDFLMKNIEK
jgi:hypothetical protein